VEKKTDFERIKGELHKLGIQSETPLDNGFEFHVSGIPFELVFNCTYDSETGLNGTLVHLSKVDGSCDTFIMHLAVEDTEQNSGRWVTYLEDRRQIGFYAFPAVLHPQKEKMDLSEAIQGILDCRKEIQERYMSMIQLVHFSIEEGFNPPGDILLLEEDHQKACESFPFWRPTLCTEDIEGILDEMGMEYEVVDLIDDIMPMKPILFWSDSEIYLIQEESNRLVLYTKMIIDPIRPDLFGPTCMRIANNIARTEYRIEHNVCTVLIRLPENTEYNDLRNRLRICTARLARFLDQLVNYSPETRKIEATHEQMRKYFIYESVKNDLTKQ